jgi:flagellar hook-basal body complex protein FliE
MTLPLIMASPAAAVQAYQATEASAPPDGAAGTDFGGLLARTLEGVVETGHAADAEAVSAIAGEGNITDVVTAISKAELALQTTVALRDRVVQAYQQIIGMPI